MNSQNDFETKTYNMNTAITPSTKRDIRALLQSDQVKQQLAMVLPKHLTPERMARVACTAVLKTPKLADCSPESLLQALMICSQAGLEPDGRNAHLIPYGNQVQVIFDYKGLISLARRNGIANIATDVVCEKDVFEWNRSANGLHFKHEINWREPRGNMYAAFVIWKDGEQFDGECMTKDEIEAIRRRSKAGSSGPWVTDFNEMSKKTVVRRASKKWPLDPEVASAMTDDDDVIDIGPPKPVKPLFAPALPEAVESDPKQSDTVNQDSEPVPPPTAEPHVPNYVKGVRTLMAASSITEAQLLDYLRRTGGADDSLSSIEEIAMINPRLVETLHDDWKMHLANIKKGTAK